MATPEQAIQILDRLASELDARVNEVELYDAAYRGEHNLRFASEDFRAYFGDRYKKFSDNWCGIVADAPHERLEITGFRLKGQEKGDADLFDTWKRNDADVFSDLAFLDAIISKRAFALVWADEDEDPTITFEHPAQAIVGYDPESRARVAGAKIWCDEDNEYATLYLPDEVYKFKRPASLVLTRLSNAGFRLPTSLRLSGGWVPRQPSTDDTWPIPNPLGKVPLVEYPNRPRLIGEPISDIAGTLPMQNAINLLWAQLFTASDYASFPQRLVIGAEMPTVPVFDDEGNEVGEKPVDLKEWSVRRAQWIEDPAAKIAQWDGADLKVWSDIVEIAVGHVAAQSRTPAHYMLIGGTIANVPEGGLKALETGLAQRTREKTTHFGRAARDTGELVALVEGNVEKAKAIRGGVVLWRDVENRSDAQRADALQKKSAIGYPLRYVLELDGLPPTEVERVMDMAKAEKEDPTLQALLRPAPAPGPSSLSAPVADDNADLGG